MKSNENPLTESLLEDVSSNLEANVPSSFPAIAPFEGLEQPLLKSLVGTDDTGMESAEDLRAISLLEDDAKAILNETYNGGRIIYADEIPVEEECLEIEDNAELFVKSESMDGLLSPIPSYDSEHLKSPMHPISDYGYESHGSPISLQDFSLKDNQDDLNFLLNDLFPALA